MPFLNMSIENVVSSVVEAMLPRFSDDKTVLVMSFDLRVQRKDDYEKPAVRRTVHLMFHRPDNYTKALWNISTKLDSYRDYQVWLLKADHDSCWRTDGVGSPFFQLVQDMANVAAPGIGCPGVEAKINFHLVDGNPKLVKLQSYKVDRPKWAFTVEYAPKVQSMA